MDDIIIDPEIITKPRFYTLSLFGSHPTRATELYSISKVKY